MTPTLVTACTALYVPTPEAKALRAVQTCTGRFRAAELSPEGALSPWGGPAALAYQL